MQTELDLDAQNYAFISEISARPREFCSALSGLMARHRGHWVYRQKSQDQVTAALLTIVGAKSGGEMPSDCERDVAEWLRYKASSRDGDELLSWLQRLLVNDPINSAAVVHLAWALGELRHQRSAVTVAQAAASQSGRVRIQLARAAAKIGNDRVDPMLDAIRRSELNPFTRIRLPRKVEPYPTDSEFERYSDEATARIKDLVGHIQNQEGHIEFTEEWVNPERPGTSWWRLSVRRSRDKDFWFAIEIDRDSLYVQVELPEAYEEFWGWLTPEERLAEAVGYISEELGLRTRDRK